MSTDEAEAAGLAARLQQLNQDRRVIEQGNAGRGYAISCKTVSWR